MKNLTEIKTLLQEHKEELFAKYPLSLMAIFGSYAREEQTHESDVDIWIDFSKPMGFELAHLLRDLQKILGEKVDLSIGKNALNKFLPYMQSNEIIYV